MLEAQDCRIDFLARLSDYQDFSFLRRGGGGRQYRFSSSNVNDEDDEDEDDEDNEAKYCFIRYREMYEYGREDSVPFRVDPHIAELTTNVLDLKSDVHCKFFLYSMSKKRIPLPRLSRLAFATTGHSIQGAQAQHIAIVVGCEAGARWLSSTVGRCEGSSLHLYIHDSARRAKPFDNEPIMTPEEAFLHWTTRESDRETCMQSIVQTYSSSISV